MKHQRRRVEEISVLVLIAALAALYLFTDVQDYLSFEALKENRDALLHYVRGHHLASVIVFFAVYFSTAFFLPGAIALTLAAGFLFGTVEGAIYVKYRGDYRRGARLPLLPISYREADTGKIPRQARRVQP